MSDIIAALALIVSIVGIPIGYLLGARNLKNAAYNSELAKLAELCDTIFSEALNIHRKRKASQYEEVDYHLMVAFHKRLQSKCSEIAELSDNVVHYPKDELRNVKKIITDQLFSDDKKISDTAIRGLIYKLDTLKTFYKPKFI